MLVGQQNIQVIGEAVRLSDVDTEETEVAVLASVSSVHVNAAGEIGILLLTDDVEIARSLLAAGIHGWGVLSPEVGREELAAGIAAVAEGLWVGSPALVEGLMRLPKGSEGLGEDALPEPLTVREKEVLQKMAEGLANKQIALVLGISEHTVKFHLSGLYAKLGAASRTEAVKRGIEVGLISL